MVTEVKMPKLGLTMTKGTVKKWLKSEGDTVQKGEGLLVIETEKVTYTIEAPASGQLLKIVAPTGATIPVGQPLAYIGEPGEPVPEVAPKVAPPVEKPAAPPPAKPAPAAPPARVRATPRARALARKEGVDLSLVQGTGPGGLITEEDVRRYIEERMRRTKLGLKVKEVVPLTPLRSTIAERMTESLREMAQVTIMREEPVDALVETRKRLLPLIEEETGRKLTYTHMLIKVVGELLKKFPLINSTLENGQIKVIEEVNVGFAVAVDHGLVVPVIKGVDGKSLKDIVVETSELATKAREGRLTLEDVSGGTFTITNLGMFGVDGFTPIINPPQVAILGVGRIVEKPVAVEGRVEVRPVVTFSLTFDHRVIDGHTAAQFLDALVKVVQSADELSKVLGAG